MTAPYQEKAKDREGEEALEQWLARVRACRRQHLTLETAEERQTLPALFLWGYACYDCCMPIPCLAFMLLLISHACAIYNHCFCLHILHLVPVRLA